MKTKTAAVAILISLCFILGCRNSPDSPTAIPIVIQGDEAAKSTLENYLRLRAPFILTNRGKYLFQIVQPDSDASYTIVQISKESDSVYSVDLIDPKTMQTTTKYDQELHHVLTVMCERHSN
jgi:hypothetical protein